MGVWIVAVEAIFCFLSPCIFTQTGRCRVSLSRPTKLESFRLQLVNSSRFYHNSGHGQTPDRFSQALKPIDLIVSFLFLGHINDEWACFLPGKLTHHDNPHEEILTTFDDMRVDLHSMTNCLSIVNSCIWIITINLVIVILFRMSKFLHQSFLCG